METQLVEAESSRRSGSGAARLDALLQQVLCRRYSQLAEAERGLGVVRLHVLQGVPLVDAQLAGGDAAAAVVAHPGQEGAAGVVVVAASYLARLVERLQGRPDAQEVKGQRQNRQQNTS